MLDLKVLTQALGDLESLKTAGGVDAKLIIGGNPTTKETCEFIGADAFTTNAAEGVKICQGWV